MTTILAALGFLLVAYWLTGVVMFTYTNVRIYPGTPLSVKLMSVGIAGFTLPFLFMQHGRLPSGSMIVPAIAETQEEADRIAVWLENVCPCRSCKERRGEA